MRVSGDMEAERLMAASMEERVTRLIEVGQALYGSQWKRPLARALDVNDRAVRNWVSGKWELPKNLEERLRKVIAEKQAVLLNVYWGWPVL
jgi:hypothetical protein